MAGTNEHTTNPTHTDGPSAVGAADLCAVGASNLGLLTRVGVVLALCGLILGLTFLNVASARLGDSLIQRAQGEDHYHTMYRELRTAAIDDRLVGRLVHDSKTMSVLHNQVDHSAVAGVPAPPRPSFDTHAAITYTACAIIAILAFFLLVNPRRLDARKYAMMASMCFVVSALCVLVGVLSFVMHLLILAERPL